MNKELSLTGAREKAWDQACMRLLLVRSRLTDTLASSDDVDGGPWPASGACTKKGVVR